MLRERVQRLRAENGQLWQTLQESQRLLAAPKPEPDPPPARRWPWQRE